MLSTPNLPIHCLLSEGSSQEPSEYDPFLDPEIEVAALPRSPYRSVMKTIRPKAAAGLLQLVAFDESVVTWRKSLPTFGFAVPIAKERNDVLGVHVCDSRDFEDFWFANVDLLSKCYDNGVGTWRDPQTDKIEIGCIWVTSSLDAAIERAKTEDEPVYWDIAQRRFFLTKKKRTN